MKLLASSARILKLLKNGIPALILSLISAPLLVVSLGKLSVINEKWFMIPLVFSVLFALYYIFLFDSSGKFKGENVFAGLTAVAFLLGDACEIAQGISPIYSGFWQVIKSILLLITYFFLVRTLARLVNVILEKNLKSFILPECFAKHPMLFFAILIILFWLPQIIIKFPGTMCYDNVTQLAQCFGYTEYASNHPMTHTLFLGICFKFGMLFNSPNVGLFTAVLVQVILMAPIFSYTLTQMLRYKLPKWAVIIAFTVYAVTPNVIGYISIPLKDIPYAALYVLYTSMLIELVYDGDAFWKSKKKAAALILSAAFIILLRKNGLVAVIPVSAWLIIRLIRSGKPAKLWIKRALAVAMTFVITLSVNFAIDLAYHPQGGSMGEPLSFFIQQTARTLRDFPEDVTQAEAAAIDKVMDYENAGKLYDPRISDPVKATWKTDASISDIASYLGAWAKMGVRHPLTYFEATVSQNYSLFYPQVDNIKYYPSVKTHHPLNDVMPQTSGLHGIKAFDSARENMTYFYEFLHNFPVIGMLSNIGFWVIMLLLLMTLSRHYKLKGMLLIAMPAFITLIMCIASPVIMLQSRYAFPIVYSMPAILCGYIVLRNKQANIDSNML